MICRYQKVFLPLLVYYGGHGHGEVGVYRAYLVQKFFLLCAVPQRRCKLYLVQRAEVGGLYSVQLVELGVFVKHVFKCVLKVEILRYGYFEHHRLLVLLAEARGIYDYEQKRD